ncbi:MAG TPA: T9SS type A sorting domain-containing protein [Saprospiraceae bacterium]|nr:T9SS type A sorting domain-containing protein [Saprospiraceae bacterium]HMQ83057.1 T9SS type A sorting domain-containing protein [Saprospiraceae bacterium]
MNKYFYALVFNCLVLDFGYSQCAFDVLITAIPMDDDGIYCSYDEVKLYATEDLISYQWYYNFSDSNTGGTAISGATESLFTVNVAEWGFAYFYVEATRDGCTEASPTQLIDSWVFLFPAIAHEPEDQYCLGDTTVISNAFGEYLGYQWFRNGQAIPGADQPTYNVTESGTYTLEVKPIECPEITLSSGVGPTFIFSGPQEPDISLEGGVLVSTSGPLYQWYLNGVAIPGATDAEYTPEVSGDYLVVVTDPASGCSRSSKTYTFTVSQLAFETNAPFQVYPNPTDDFLLIKDGSASGGLYQYQLIHILGHVVQQSPGIMEAEYRLDVHDFAPGWYQLKIICEGRNIIFPILIQ